MGWSGPVFSFFSGLQNGSRNEVMVKKSDPSIRDAVGHSYLSIFVPSLWLNSPTANLSGA
jgi:hypothetical protein